MWVWGGIGRKDVWTAGHALHQIDCIPAQSRAHQRPRGSRRPGLPWDRNPARAQTWPPSHTRQNCPLPPAVMWAIVCRSFWTTVSLCPMKLHPSHNNRPLQISAAVRRVGPGHTATGKPTQQCAALSRRFSTACTCPSPHSGAAARCLDPLTSSLGAVVVHWAYSTSDHRCTSPAWSAAPQRPPLSLLNEAGPQSASRPSVFAPRSFLGPSGLQSILGQRHWHRTACSSSSTRPRLAAPKRAPARAGPASGSVSKGSQCLALGRVFTPYYPGEHRTP
ncbi:hypothetical protein NDU88_001480 [Pleurodeles waltl]|uniref:Uncharacterized protein n=1 Tax=Pleurodeles waltl TaxID=8319 RepID=A0AAV7SZJ9_PLEWA|nr:hypothetical protein NDU88_001480 [Pleurodeles waltl]